MSPIEENPDRYVVDDRHVRLAAFLVVLGALLIAAGTAAFGFARPLVGSFFLLLGICAASFGLFFRPGEQTHGASCFLFGTFLASGAGALIVLVYAGIRSLIH